MFFGDHQRMIACCLERTGNMFKQPSVIVCNERSFSVHKLRRMSDRSSERISDCLMTETDAEYRSCWSKPSNQFHTDSGVFRSAGSRRNEYAARVHSSNIIKTEFIVPHNANIVCPLPNELDKVVGK